MPVPNWCSQRAISARHREICLGCFGLFLYLDTLGMAGSALTVSFILTMKVRKYLSSFMALPINAEASYHQRIKISNEIVQWKLCLLN